MALILNSPLINESNVIRPLQNSQPGGTAFELYPFSDVLTQFILEFPEEPKGRMEKDCSIRGKSSWQEVLEVLKSEGEAYVSSHGVKGRMKKLARVIGENADKLERVTDIIPDVDYSKPILGALKFLLEAFKQTSKVREEVRRGVEDLQTKFEMIEDYLRLFATKQRVAKSVMNLYVSILKGIEDVIGYYTRNVFIKSLGAVWSGERYEESLLKCLEKIDEDGKELMKAASHSHMEEGHMTAEDVKLVLKRVDSMNNSQKALKTSFDGAMDVMVKDHKRLQEESLRQRREAQFYKRQLEAITAENAQLQLQRQHNQAIAPPSRHADPIVSQSDLFEFLDTAGLDSIDINYIMESQEAFLERGQDRTEIIMNSPKFRNWMVSPSSKELLLHGNSDPQTISPLSLFCAMCIDTLRRVDKFWSMAFFCGCHPFEDGGGARLLITTLIAEILERQPFDMSFISHDHVYWMNHGHIETFCYVFGQLVQQVEADHTIFCFIDGINFYEGEEELLEETAYVIRFLLDLTDGHTVFKILLTSSSITIDVREAVDDADYLPLPREVSDSDDFSRLRFQRHWEDNVEL